MRSLRSATASAPGNLFLCGEYGVLSGTPAILLAPSRRCTASCAPSEEPVIAINSADFGRVQLPMRAGLGISGEIPRAIRALTGLVAEYLADSPTDSGLQIDITNDIPVGAGMSSSTAVLVAVAAALSTSLGYETDRETLRAKALPWQTEIHGGRASGVEFFSTLYGGIHWVTESEAVPLPIELPKIIVADTGLRRATAKGVASYRDQPGFVQKLHALCLSGRTFLEEGDWLSLGKVMISVHELLRTIGVSNESLDRLVAAAREAGAWGAKLSGAGGGGVVFALVPTAATAGVVSELAAAGAAAVFEVRVDNHGVEVK